MIYERQGFRPCLFCLMVQALDMDGMIVYNHTKGCLYVFLLRGFHHAGY